MAFSDTEQIPINAQIAASTQSAKNQMAFQERMSNTAHQREVADLKAAGLNPVLSAHGNGASTPSGAEGDYTGINEALFDMLMTSINTSASAVGGLAKKLNRNSSDEDIGVVMQNLIDHISETTDPENAMNKLRQHILGVDSAEDYYMSPEVKAFLNKFSVYQDNRGKWHVGQAPTSNGKYKNYNKGWQLGDLLYAPYNWLAEKTYDASKNGNYTFNEWIARNHYNNKNNNDSPSKKSKTSKRYVGTSAKDALEEKKAIRKLGYGGTTVNKNGFSGNSGKFGSTPSKHSSSSHSSSKSRSV